ncbi:hypothetical protein SHM_13630 [Spiroplasma ixodetis]|uniref:Uncharacterized protein n=1 Tax=Spiroplasma ixodetis TaxID=2141 RepID=A0ABN6SXL3_9MOLU|nr:hypothetical protein SHM_13630 [Spiroplasma ixodetis]
MPKQRKELGNYKEKIQEYLRENKDNLKKCTKQELNYILNVDNKCKIVKVSATKLFFYSNIRLVKDNLVFFWVFGLKTI